MTPWIRHTREHSSRVKYTYHSVCTYVCMTTKGKTLSRFILYQLVLMHVYMDNTFQDTI